MHVVAISGPIGGGKTAVARAITERLGDATLVHFDGYEKATRESIAYLMEWVAKGANFDDLAVPGLAGDLAKLKQGASILHPLTRAPIASAKYIIFEMPLGREHRDTAPLIDLVIWIDVPPDLALARKLKEFTTQFLSRYAPEAQRDCMIWLDDYLGNYMRVVRRVLEIQRERVSVNADIVIDGQGPLETVVECATGEILKRLP
jgi:uridine kinase